MAPEASGGGGMSTIRRGWCSDGAIISECGLYRYWLGRSRDEGEGLVTFIMLNPSTADDRQDDPTIRRCLGFAASWGKQQVVILNIFGLRSTDPGELLKVRDPIGPENDAALAKAEGLIVCAWGNWGWLNHRGARVRSILVATHTQRVYCLGRTKRGQPKHPLYLRADLQPMALA